MSLCLVLLVVVVVAVGLVLVLVPVPVPVPVVRSWVPPIAILRKGRGLQMAQPVLPGAPPAGAREAFAARGGRERAHDGYVVRAGEEEAPDESASIFF